MHTGRKRFTSSKLEIPYVVIGLFVITLFFIIANFFLLQTDDPILPFLLSINVGTFFLFGLDKVLASMQKERVPERVLYVFCVLGGTLGGFLGMYVLRHKTQKGSFQAAMGGILLLQIALYFVIKKLL